MAAVTNSLWGCVLSEIGAHPSGTLKVVDRPFRVTSASVQKRSSIQLTLSSDKGSLSQSVSVLATLDPVSPPVEIAYLDISTQKVGLGLTFKTGDMVLFNKQTRGMSAGDASKVDVQLTGYYLDPDDVSTETCLDALGDIQRKLDLLLHANTVGDVDRSHVTLQKHECEAKRMEKVLKELREENVKLKSAMAALEDENSKKEEEIKRLLDEELRKLRFD